MSSSSSESSDDELLNSPAIFKKRDGRQTRAENAKLDFLDSCLSGTNARADVHRRIAEVDKEQMVFHRKQGDIKSEEKDDGDEEEDGSGGETKEVSGGIGDMSINSEAGSGNDICKSNSSDSIKDKTTTTTSTTIAIKPETSVRIEADDSYWERVENFAKLNSSTRTPNKKSTSNLNSSRRRLNDQMAGIDCDSETDDEELGDGDGMTREQRRSEAVARATGGQTCIGLRRMFRGGRERRVVEKKIGTLCFYMFQSREDATNELISIVAKLDRVHRTSKTESDKVLRERFIFPLSKLLESSQGKIWGRGPQSLASFLVHNPVISSGLEVACGCDTSCALIVPEVFCQWLWKVACSTFGGTEVLTTRSCRLLVKYIAERMDDEPKDSAGDCGQESHCIFGAELGFLTKFQMSDMVTCLEKDFGLWLQPGFLPTNVNCSNDDEEEKKDTNNDASTLNVSGMKNMFLLWTALLDRDFISLGENSEDASTIGESASMALVALARVCLDPNFYFANDTT
jgi:hypothetical protein